MMHEVNLTAENRNNTGKEAANALRKNGKLPGVIYGLNFPARSITLNERDFHTFLRKAAGKTHLIQMNLGEAAPIPVILKEVQRDPVSDAIIHADFEFVDLARKIVATVPLHLVGIPLGVKDQGGVLQHGLRDIKVRCLMAHLPEQIEVDVSEMKIGTTLHVSDLQGENIEFISDSHNAIAMVLGKKSEEEKGESGETGAEGTKSAEDNAKA